MKCFVTGGAGFIGSHLVDALLELESSVTVFDNFSSGKYEFVKNHIGGTSFRLIEGDLLGDKVNLQEAVAGHDIVFHFAANPDASLGVKYPYVDLNQETIATYNVLEAMKNNGVKKIVFASSGTVYGDRGIERLAESSGPMLPISMYGAGKLASEGLISAFCHTFDMQGWIFRFGNVVGPRATHGVIVDFINKLTKDPTTLEVLGDGYQRKPYFHVRECIAGILVGIAYAHDRVNLFNLGCDTTTNVRLIAQLVINQMNLKDVKINFGKENRGWPGDVPQVQLDSTKMGQLGWSTELTSDEAVSRAIMELLQCK